MNLVDLVSVIAGSAILLGLICSIALDGLRQRTKSRNGRTISAVDYR
jgi:hypothetical protein